MLKWVFGADTGPFRKGLSQMREEVGAFAGGVKGMIAGAFGVGAIVEMIDKISRVSDLAERLGMSAESVQKIGYAAGQAGVDIEGTAKALTILQKNLAGVDESGGEAADALKVLGLNAEEFKGLAPEDQMVALSKGYTEASDQGQALAAVMKLMGKGGAEMATLLSEGPEALKDALDEANPATNEQVKNIENLGDKISQLKAQAVPVFAWLVEAFMSIGPVIGWVGNTITEQFGTALDYLKDQFGTIGKVIKSTFTFDWDAQAAALKTYGERHAKMVDDMSKNQREINTELSDKLTEIHYGNGEAPKPKGTNKADPEDLQKSAEELKKLIEEIGKLEEENRLRQLSLDEKILDLKKQQAELAAEADMGSGNAALEARKKELEISKELAGFEKQKADEAAKAEDERAGATKEIESLKAQGEKLDRDHRMSTMTDEQKITELKREQAKLAIDSATAAAAGDVKTSLEKQNESKGVQSEIDALSAKNKPVIPTIISDDLRKVGGGGGAFISGGNPQAGVETRLDRLYETMSAIEKKMPAIRGAASPFDS